METSQEITTILELVDKDYKTTIITMLNEVKKNMLEINEMLQNVSRKLILSFF